MMNVKWMIGMGLGCTLFTGQSMALDMRASENFVSSLDQIEGDVDPVTLGSYSEKSLGATTYDVTVNGDGTIEAFTDYNAAASPALFPAIGFDNADVPDPINSDTGWTIETRFRIDSATDPDRGVWEIYMRDNDGSNGPLSTRIHFLSTGIDRDNSGNGVNAEVQADLTDDFHVVRIVGHPGGGNLTSVYLDGELVIDQLTSLSFTNEEYLRIGRWGGATRGGTATIDYIRFDTTGAYAPIPEPASIALLGLGGLMILRRKR